MGGAALTGKDTTILGGRIFKDFATGDAVSLEFPNNLVEGKPGKNGNVIYAFNASGKLVTATLRLLIGSSDDKYMNSRLNAYINDPSSFVLLTGEFIKRVGDGKGNITNVDYILDGGVIQKIPGAKDNVEGDVEQGISIWVVTFANTDRVLA